METFHGSAGRVHGQVHFPTQKIHQSAYDNRQSNADNVVLSDEILNVPFIGHGDVA